MELQVFRISSLLGGAENGLEASLSRGCLAARVAPEKLVEAMEMDTRVKIREACRAGESLGMAALGGHRPPGTCMCILPAPGLLLCPVTPMMKTLNTFTFTFTCSGRYGLQSRQPGWRTEISQGPTLWQLQPLKQDVKGEILLRRCGCASMCASAIPIYKVQCKHHGGGSQPL